MTSMCQRCRCRALIWPIVIALLCTIACSRPAGVPAAGASEPPQAPFRGDGGVTNGASETSISQSTTPASNSLPFHDVQNLPAGTLLTVRLKGPVTAGSPVTQVTFEGVVDEPVVVEGNTLIPRGAPVAGRIESARISKVKRDRAYVRLALASVRIGGLDVPIQTASLFARQTPQGDTTIRMEKGRRLVFRLMQPVVLNTQRADLAH